MTQQICIEIDSNLYGIFFVSINFRFGFFDSLFGLDQKWNFRSDHLTFRCFYFPFLEVSSRTFDSSPKIMKYWILQKLATIKVNHIIFTNRFIFIPNHDSYFFISSVRKNKQRKIAKPQICTYHRIDFVENDRFSEKLTKIWSCQK